MHNGGWRVSSKKPGLADLKRLAREAAARPTPAAHPPSGPAGSGGGSVASQARPVVATAQDMALFRRLAGAVVPVDTRNRILHTPAPAGLLADADTTAPGGLQTRQARATQGQSMAEHPPPDAGLSDADVSHLLCEDGTAFVRQGVGPDVLKKLAARFWRLEADLDLHGMTIDQARPRLAAFLTQCVAYDARCVRIVHGKGYGSPDARPILRDKVRAWLVGSNDVRAFAQASERDGGAGATVVLLHIDDRRARDRRAP